MTVIGQMFEEKMQKEILIATEKVTKEVTEQANRNMSNKLSQIAENILRHGESPEMVAECTGLSLEQVHAIETRLLQTV